MSEFQIFHNPRCSKSRETLALLKENGIEPEVIEYLTNPPTPEQLDAVIRKLQVEPQAIVRKKETLYKEMELADKTLTRSEWLQTLADNPKLIERPIVIRGQSARIGRPPEAVMELF